MTKLEQEIKQLQKQIADKQEQLKRQQEELVKLTPVHKLAIAIHSATCHSNHIDMCDWHYSIKDGRHDWSGWAHQRALERAKAMQKSCTEIAIGDMIKIVECLK